MTCVYSFGSSWDSACTLWAKAWFRGCGPDISDTGHPLCGEAYEVRAILEEYPSFAGCTGITFHGTAEIDEMWNGNGGVKAWIDGYFEMGSSVFSIKQPVNDYAHIACYEYYDCIGEKIYM